MRLSGEPMETFKIFLTLQFLLRVTFRLAVVVRHCVREERDIMRHH